jgi:uncharacterized protein YPO0396
VKRLTRIRLLNWYHILDEVLPIEGSALFMGDNGSGKSTILDALQFALVADLQLVKFNQAANEAAARSLQGYTRWMINSGGSRDTAEYRRGDCTSHVLLEFQEDEKPFVVGAVIDSFKDGRDPKRLHFTCNDAGIADIPVYREGSRVPLSCTDFGKQMRLRSGFFGSQEPGAFRDNLLTRLGRLSPDFTQILVKAQAFRPLGQVHQFVMDFLLDPKPLETASLRENLASYKALEQKAHEAEKRVELLSQIVETGSELEKICAEIRTFSYLEMRAEAGIHEERLDALEKERDEVAVALAAGREALNRIEAEKLALEEEIGSLHRSLIGNSAFQERERTRSDLARAKVDLAKAEEVLKKAEAALAELDRLLKELEKRGTPCAASVKTLEEVAYASRKEADRSRDELTRIQAEGEELKNRLAELKKGVRPVPKPSRVLRELIEDELHCRPRYLCELIEVQDERWQAAVEGYLNTRRFDIIVDPKHFLPALSLYEGRKRQLGLQGVGLVDAEKLAKAEPRVKPGSLAEIVTSENRWAKAYADFVLGEVIRVESELDLRKHSRAITPTCMVYQNHVARQTPFDVFENWYIGSRGAERMAMKLEADIGTAVLRFQSSADSLTKAEEQAKLAISALEVGRLAESFEDARAARKSSLLAAERLEAHLASIDLGEIAAIEARLEARKSRRTQAETEEKRLIASVAQGEQRAAQITEGMGSASRERDLAMGRLAIEFTSLSTDVLAGWEERYQDERRKGRTAEKIRDVFQSSWRGRSTQRTNVLERLSAMRTDYNNRFGFNGPAQGEPYHPYLEELSAWKESQLPEYRLKIEKAKDSALQQLMEDIVHKLRENLDLIPLQFEGINRALRGFHFGQDQYQFIYEIKTEYKAFERLVREAAHYERQPLFETNWKERFRDGGALEALFESLVQGSSAQVEDELKQYSDYREYYSYDLKVLHSDGTTSLFSRVSKLKSGGETQAPYYIAVIASLYRLYRLQPEVGAKGRQAGGTIGLVLLDEAFNKMDEDRLKATLEFTRKLGLQLILATPKERAEFIIPHIETCYLVAKDPQSGYAYLHDFHQELDHEEKSVREVESVVATV